MSSTAAAAVCDRRVEERCIHFGEDLIVFDVLRNASRLINRNVGILSLVDLNQQKHISANLKRICDETCCAQISDFQI